jgi:glycosyltransferase involved in cell wall biosynthesis
MIICQIITSLVYGGAEKLLVNFSNVLAEKHEIHIIYLKGEPNLQLSFDPRIKIYHVPLALNCAKNIRLLIKKIKPDIVHTHLGHADLIGMYACRGMPVKLYCTMHNVYFKWNWIDNIFFFLYYITFKTHGRKCKVSCISKAVAEHTHKRLGVPLENIRINYNSVPDIIITETKEQARKDLNLNANNFCLLTIGRLRVQKSTETLLQAIALIKDDIISLRVLIVGEGEQEHFLKELSTTLNISSIVEFRGGTQTPEKYYSASDLFVLPSVFEGLPTVVLEAFRSSLPVIASNIDGTNELIEDGFNGLLFEPKNYQELAKHILKVYETSELRKQLGENGYKSYKNKYDIINYAAQIETLYLE